MCQIKKAGNQHLTQGFLFQLHQTHPMMVTMCSVKFFTLHVIWGKIQMEPKKYKTLKKNLPLEMELYLRL